jgi:hypothetical protein
MVVRALGNGVTQQIGLAIIHDNPETLLPIWEDVSAGSVSGFCSLTVLIRNPADDSWLTSRWWR